MSKADCPFCDPSFRVIKSNDTAFVLLSNPRKVPGHTLVIPRNHTEKPWDLTDKEILDIFELIFFVENKLIGKLGDGFDIRQNYRPFTKQDTIKIDHLHFHVIPRSHKDYIYQKVEIQETDIFATLNDQERTEVTRLITT